MSFQYSIVILLASSHCSDFNYRNKALTSKLVNRDIIIIKLRKALSKFYRQHSGLVQIFHVSLKKLLRQVILEPKLYGVYKFRNKRFRNLFLFSEQFRQNIYNYKRIRYNLDIMRHTAYLVVYPNTVESYAFLL